MYRDHIWPFTTFISRNKHNKNIRLRLYWLRLYWLRLRLRCKLLMLNVPNENIYIPKERALLQSKLKKYQHDIVSIVLE